MKSVVILGAGQAGQALCKLLDPNQTEIVAIGDNNPDTWTDEAEIPVLSVAEALRCRGDLVIVGVLGAERDQQLRRQVQDLGYTGEVLSLHEIASSFDLRSAALKSLAARLRELEVAGAIAELGVYRGDFAWQLNEQFPERKLYLFDTFAGFVAQDIQVEQQLGASAAGRNDFSNTSAADVLARMPHEAQVVIRQGHFPETARDLEEQFALVSLDADLYAPTLAGLSYFYPRLSPGGVLLLHDYNSNQYPGVKKAVQDYEARAGRLLLMPLNDLHGSAVIMHP